MQSKWLLSSALVGCFAFGWCAHLLTAQHRKPVTIMRIYTGSDGETHAEEITGNLKSDPSRNGIEFSDPIKVASLVFARTSPGWVRDWHQETVPHHIEWAGRIRDLRRSQSFVGAGKHRSGWRLNREGSYLSYLRNRRPHCAELPLADR